MAMRVYTKVVWDKDGKIVEEEFFDYDGPVALAHATTFLVQNHFRWRTDTGNIDDTPTWAAAEDTNIELDLSGGDVTLRLRYAIQETGGASTGNIDLGCWVSKNGATRTFVNTGSSGVNIGDNASTATREAADTSRLSGTGSYEVAGRAIDGANPTTGFQSWSANNWTELEVTLDFTAADLSDGDTLDFNLSTSPDASYVALNSVRVNPRVTIRKSGGGPGTIRHKYAGAAATDGSGNWTAAESLPIKQGDLVLFTVIALADIAFVAPTDNHGNFTFTTFVNAGLVGSGAQQFRTLSAYFIASADGDVQPKNTGGPTSSGVRIAMNVFEGPFSAIDINTTPVTSDVNSPYDTNSTGTLSQADELVVTGYELRSATIPTAIPSGYSAGNLLPDPLGNGRSVVSAWKVVSATTSQSASWVNTVNQSGEVWLTTFALDVGPLTYTIDADLDALITAQNETLAASLNAQLQKEVTVTASVDALLATQQTLATDIDALISKLNVPRTVSLDGLLFASGITNVVDLDALLSLTASQSVSIDALLTATGLTRTASLDALLTALGVTITVSLDALATKTNITATVDLDGLLASTKALTSDLDALLQKTVTQTAALNALLTMLDVTQTTSLDGLLTALAQSDTASLDAYLTLLQTQSATLDALLQKTEVRTVVLDALLNATVTETVDLDALLFKANNLITASLDAILFSDVSPTELVSLDALVEQLNILRTANLDAMIGQTYNRVVSLDALLTATGVTRISTLDAFLSKLGLTSQASIDAAITKLNETLQIDLDGLLSVGVETSTTIDALLSLGQANNVSLDGMLTALGVTRTVTLDALISSTQTVVTTLDGLLANSVTSAINLDGILQKSVPVTISLDGLLNAGITAQVTLDSALQKLDEQEQVDLDAVISTSVALIAALDAAQFTKGETRSANLDALLRQTVTVSAMLDGLLSKVGIESTTNLDALLGEGGMITVQLDAIKSSRAIVVHQLDAILAGFDISRSVALDAILSDFTARKGRRGLRLPSDSRQTQESESRKKQLSSKSRSKQLSTRPRR